MENGVCDRGAGRTRAEPDRLWLDREVTVLRDSGCHGRRRSTARDKLSLTELRDMSVSMLVYRLVTMQ